MTRREVEFEPLHHVPPQYWFWYYPHFISLGPATQVKKQRLMHEITGLNGTKCLTSNYAVTCTLSSANEAGGEEVTILAHVVDCITSDYGPQDLGGIRALPFLEGKQLADPVFDQSGTIDLCLA